MFPSRRAKLEQEFKAKLQTTTGDEARAFFKRRLAFLEQVRLGGRVPEQSAATKPKPGPARKAPVSFSDDDLLKDARQIMADATESGMKPLLTEKHRLALQKAGEL